jgi:hypothetical protein
MNPIARNVSTLWRLQRSLNEAELRRTSKRITMTVIAGAVCFLALVMLNIAGFSALTNSYGNAFSALAVAAIDVLVAVILIVAAQSIKLAPETDTVRELRDSVLADIEEDAQTVQNELVQLRDDVKSIGSQVSSFASDPLGNLPSLLIPAINAFTKVARSSKK